MKNISIFLINFFFLFFFFFQKFFFFFFNKNNLFFLNCSLSNWKKKNIFSFNFLYFFDYFFKKYFLLKLQKNLFLKINKIDFFLNSKSFLFAFFLKFFKKLLIKLKISNFFFKNLIILFLNFFFFIDSNFFLNWLKQFCEGIDFRWHKSIFLFLKLLLNNFFKKFSNYFGFLGYYFYVKGKISTGGSSKKKKLIFKNGKTTLLDNHIRISYSKNIIRNNSGVLGVLFFISFI